MPQNKSCNPETHRNMSLTHLGGSCREIRTRTHAVGMQTHTCYRQHPAESSRAASHKFLKFSAIIWRFFIKKNGNTSRSLVYDRWMAESTQRSQTHKRMQLSAYTLPESLWEQAELPEEIPGKKELTVWSSIGTLLVVGIASYRWTQLLMDWLRLASIRQSERKGKRKRERETVKTEK